jgi:hypothetical protein
MRLIERLNSSQSRFYFTWPGVEEEDNVTEDHCLW